MTEISTWLAQYGVILGAVLIAFFLVVIGVFRSRRQFPYQAMPSLFSAAELKFRNSLEQTVGKRIRVYAKVRIADVVRVRRGLNSGRYYRAFNAIACKHLDYVLCEADSGAIIAVIELDDRSHQRADRRERDAFVDSVMKAAGIPILHFPVQSRYDPRELQLQLRHIGATRL